MLKRRTVDLHMRRRDPAPLKGSRTFTPQPPDVWAAFSSIGQEYLLSLFCCNLVSCSAANQFVSVFCHRGVLTVSHFKAHRCVFRTPRPLGWQNRRRVEDVQAVFCWLAKCIFQFVAQCILFAF